MRVGSGSTRAALVLAALAVALGGAPVRAATDADGDAIPDSTDVCPLEAGTVPFSGCSDIDGDPVPDAFDLCPADPGEASFAGCSDADGDSVSDPLDACPDEPGEPSLAGCPDADRDFVADLLDRCSDEPGDARLAGCGDSDGDLSPNGLDACPDVQGPPEAGGCPDSDGDLLPDQFDACLAELGPPEFGGCPSLESIPAGVVSGSIQESFGFGSAGGGRQPEGFQLCYGLYDPGIPALTEAVIFAGFLIRPSDLTQTFELSPDLDPKFAAVASALESGPPEGIGFGFSVGFSHDCTGSGGTAAAIPVAAGASIGSFVLSVPPFSIVESAPDFFEVNPSSAQFTLSVLRFSFPEGDALSDADYDGLPIPFDACPDQVGPSLGGGCPDSDLDGIPDPTDLCPDAADPFGCPDSDADALPDAFDFCPASPGAPQLGGCPDDDGDGSPLPVDACPDQSGPFHGCLDSDLDAFADPVDFCVAQPGSFVGCPDSDGDAIPDSIDGCPFEPSPLELQCSDADADGVIDSFDNCPIDPNPDQTDTDGDGPGDACDADDDADGLPDSYESAQLCLSALAPDADGDADEDGLSQLEEFGLGTDPCDPDSDSDGLPDGVEIYGLGPFGTDPLDPDSDGDEAPDGSDNCPKSFHEETGRSGFNPDQADLDGDGRGDVCDPDADGDGIPGAADACSLVGAGSFDADSDGCRDTLPGFAGLVSGRGDLPDNRRKTLLSKTADAEHLLCEVENIDAGVRKLRDLQDYLGAQTGKSIPEGTSGLLSSYLGNLIQQSQAGDGVCSLP